MLFVTIPYNDLARYSYMSSKLRELLLNLRTARKTLESFANTCFDKSFAKCIHLFTSESLQCENEIASQIESLDGCPHYDKIPQQKSKPLAADNLLHMDSVCEFCEKAYIDKYRQMLKDSHLGSSLKSLMQNHLRLFLSSLTQLQQFTEAAVN